MDSVKIIKNTIDNYYSNYLYPPCPFTVDKWNNCLEQFFNTHNISNDVNKKIIIIRWALLKYTMKFKENNNTLDRTTKQIIKHIIYIINGYKSFPRFKFNKWIALLSPILTSKKFKKYLIKNFCMNKIPENQIGIIMEEVIKFYVDFSLDKFKKSQIINSQILKMKGKSIENYDVIINDEDMNQTCDEDNRNNHVKENNFISTYTDSKDLLIKKEENWRNQINLETKLYANISILFDKGYDISSISNGGSMWIPCSVIALKLKNKVKYIRLYFDLIHKIKIWVLFNDKRLALTNCDKKMKDDGSKMMKNDNNVGDKIKKDNVCDN